MGQAIKENTYLSCGCCGCCFITWEGYTDQDQDQGFGICQECQAEAEARNNAMLDEIGAKLRDALGDKNKAKFDAMTLDQRRIIAMKAVNDGAITWSFGGHE